MFWKVGFNNLPAFNNLSIDTKAGNCVSIDSVHVGASLPDAGVSPLRFILSNDALNLP